ncbi:hypothetical protein HN789_00480 [archaeon]|jgi:hypothetical protein|nr:hypothetical protein [archaeon]MBT4023202.1 hypothetical protein [archaeon]MBT4272408.1 hypothetical protein [archaeon]MBT4460971.1 hypothetical protein [archaeon]MBT4859115.1 hypothetical protein [archaeon]
MGEYLFETPEEMKGELNRHLYAVEGSLEIAKLYEKGSAFFRQDHGLPRFGENQICPFMPGNLDIVTLFYASLEKLPETIVEVGFGNGQNLWMLNNILGQENLIGYEPNSKIFDWVKKIVAPAFSPQTTVVYNLETIDYTPSEFPKVALIKDFFQEDPELTSEMNYFLWLNEDLLPEIVERFQEDLKLQFIGIQFYLKI